MTFGKPQTTACSPSFDPAELDWEKSGGLLPAIVQDEGSSQVLMLGFMTLEALEATLSSGLVTFFSRTKKRLWQKGETSGNTLRVIHASTDCDRDTLLIVARPNGPTCHLGQASCFASSPKGHAWLGELERIVTQRAADRPAASYTADLFKAGRMRIAQKVGEEAVEVILAATPETRDECVSEISDLMFHLTVLMRALDIAWSDVGGELARRSGSN